MGLFPNVGRNKWMYGTIVALLCIGVFLHLVPFYLMVSLSLTPAADTLQGPSIIPAEPTLSAWKLIFSSGFKTQLPEPFWVYLRNSLVMVLGTLLISLPLTSMAAYANSKLLSGRWQRILFFVFIGTLMIPQTVTLVPSFLLTRNFPFPLPTAPMIPGTEMVFPTLRIWDTPWAFILPSVFNAFSFLLFKGYFDTIPDSIIQAGQVDGGSHFNIFRKIVLPMCIPVYAVAGWTQFTALWDAYLWPLIVIQTPDKIPTSVAIAEIMNKFIMAGTTSPEQAAAMTGQMQELMQAGLSWNGLMVLGILQTIPIFIAFIICREYLLKGIRIHGLK